MVNLPNLHRILLAVVLLGNTIAFAGIDPPARAVTAVLALILVVDLRRVPTLPRTLRLGLWILAGLSLVHLLPLPAAVRALLQPGLTAVMHDGWAPLSLAPWATVQFISAGLVMVGIALTAARMAQTRSGLPVLLALIAATAALLAVLGIAGEAGAPDKVLLFRDNTAHGGPYGPFVNSNHFALAILLALPAAMVLFAAASRQLALAGEARRRAAVVMLATGVTLTICMAALFRSGSRGGIAILAVAALLTAPLWRKARPARRAAWLLAGVLVIGGAGVLATTRYQAVRDDFANLFVVEGLEGNTRWELWAGTLRLWQRCPLVGSGFGSYRHTIGLDKPATQEMVLETAHNDWLEMLASGGAVGGLGLLLVTAALALMLRPGTLRNLRFEFRYPLAGAAMALLGTALHEGISFGLHIPLPRYLLAAWIGMLVGLSAKVAESKRRREQSTDESAGEGDDDGPVVPLDKPATTVEDLL